MYLATQKVLVCTVGRRVSCLSHQNPQGQVQDVTRAVKLLRTGAGPKDKEDFLREAEVMLQLDDPNLVRTRSA